MIIMALVKRDIWQSVEDMLATYIKMVIVPNLEDINYIPMIAKLRESLVS